MSSPVPSVLAMETKSLLQVSHLKELICGEVLNGTNLRAQSVETQIECCTFCKNLIAREIAPTLLALLWHVGTTNQYSTRIEATDCYA